MSSTMRAKDPMVLDQFGSGPQGKEFRPLGGSLRRAVVIPSLFLIVSHLDSPVPARPTRGVRCRDNNVPSDRMFPTG